MACGRPWSSDVVLGTPRAGPGGVLFNFYCSFFLLCLCLSVLHNQDRLIGGGGAEGRDSDDGLHNAERGVAILQSVDEFNFNSISSSMAMFLLLHG